MNADYGETFCLGAFTNFEPLASCMSSPSAQETAPHVLDLGEAPPRVHLAASHGVQLRATSVAPPIAFVLGVSRSFPANSNNSQGHTVTTTGTASCPQDFADALQANHAPYVSSPQGPPPSRTSFARTVPHLPIAAQRTSESSSAASGSDSPFPFQILSASTLVPPGDEHTDALLQSLMSGPNKPGVQTSKGHPGAGNYGSRPPDARLFTLGNAPAPAVEIVFSHQASRPFAPSGGGAADGSLSQTTASCFRVDDGHLPRSYGTVTASAAAVAAASNSAPYGTAHICQPAAPSPMAAAALAVPPLPDGHLALLLDHNLMLVQPGALPRATGAQAEFALGIIPRPDLRELPLPPLPSHGLASTVHEAACSARQHMALAPDPPQAAIHTRAAPAALVTAAVLKQQQQQQQRAYSTVGRHGSTERAQQSRSTVPRLQQQQQPTEQRADEVMCDAWVTELASVAGTPSAAEGTAAPGAVAGSRRAGLSAGGCAEGSRSQAANPSGDGSESGRVRRLGDAALTGDKEVSSSGLRVAEKEACHSSIGVNAGAESEAARAQSAPAGSLARFSSGDVCIVATNQGETGLPCVRSSSVGQGGQGDLDDRPATQGEDDTSSEGDDGSARLHLSRKRTASQRRRGSVAARKELCRERNRTAQRKFRERQKDLIKALQEQVERQENLIADLESRLAVYEDVLPPSVQLLRADGRTDTHANNIDVDIADTDEGLPKLSGR